MNYPNETDEEYHSKSIRQMGVHGNMAFSDLKIFEKNPATLKRTMDGENITAPTDAMRKGTAIHKECLEQEKAYLNYRPEDYTPSGSVSTKKETKSFQERAARLGLPIYNTKELTVHNKQVDAFDHHPYVQSIMDGAKTEVVLRHGETVSCQSKIDILNEEKCIIADIKTCQSLASLPYEIKKRRYDCQLAFYRRLYYHITGDLADCYVIGLEKEWPFQCGIWRVETYLLEANQLYIETMLQKYLNCRGFDSWPTGYEQPLDYPVESFNYAKGVPYGT